MISTKESPDQAIRVALARMFQDPVWGSTLERACDSGLAALQAKSARFAAALTARERDLDITVDDVALGMVSLAQELHPESQAAIESLASPTLGSDLPPDDGPDNFPTWDDAWAVSERRRASLYIISRVADEDLPYLNAEYAELFAAEDARDTTRYSTAIRALVKAGLTTLRREGRLLPDPASAPTAELDRSDNEGSSSAT